MTLLRYYSGGKLQEFHASSLSAASVRPGVRGAARGAKSATPSARRAGVVARALHSQHDRLATRFQAMSESSVLTEGSANSGVLTIATESVVVDGAKSGELKWLRDKHGMEIVKEGRQGKVLLRAPAGGAEGVAEAFAVAAALFKRGHVGAAHPNFVRALRHTARSKKSTAKQWNLHNPGNPGVYGADVHAQAAWTIAQGDAAIRVAVLDEGVDTLHPALAPAVVAQLDVVDQHGDARPDGDDAHGTACAGIILSRDAAVRGLAAGVSLVACRIAKGDGDDGWVFDDFDTADAIDWCWDEAKADVLSNSWGGGPPADVITRAFDRARTKGRGGKGCVVLVAAGNDQLPVDYPATLAFVLAVGASNQWDERKVKNSRDGETRWGSNFGPELGLLAPGVAIRTTDISGANGYTTDDFVPDFNGTSSATPHVAAAAALILSVAPALKEGRIREIIKETADQLAPKARRDDFVGHGRLNTYAALRKALRE